MAIWWKHDNTVLLVPSSPSAGSESPATLCASLWLAFDTSLWASLPHYLYGPLSSNFEIKYLFSTEPGRAKIIYFHFMHILLFPLFFIPSCRSEFSLDVISFGLKIFIVFPSTSDRFPQVFVYQKTSCLYYILTSERYFLLENRWSEDTNSQEILCIGFFSEF